MSQSVLTTKRDPFRWLKVSIAFLSALAFLFPIVWMFFCVNEARGNGSKLSHRLVFAALYI